MVFKSKVVWYFLEIITARYWPLFGPHFSLWRQNWILGQNFLLFSPIVYTTNWEKSFLRVASQIEKKIKCKTKRSPKKIVIKIQILTSDKILPQYVWAVCTSLHTHRMSRERNVLNFSLNRGQKDRLEAHYLLTYIQYGTRQSTTA